METVVGLAATAAIGFEAKLARIWMARTVCHDCERSVAPMLN